MRSSQALVFFWLTALFLTQARSACADSVPQQHQDSTTDSQAIEEKVTQGDDTNALMPEITLKQHQISTCHLPPEPDFSNYGKNPDQLYLSKGIDILSDAMDTAAIAVLPINPPSASLLKPNPLIAQTPPPAAPPPSPANSTILRQGSSVLGKPEVNLQGVYKLEGDDSSARARVRAYYPVNPHLMFGAVVDLTTGDGFSDTSGTGLQLNELYVAASLPELPNLRFVAGLMDLTSYFDRNSFAKDGASQFFNRAFQTNPALSAAGLGSRVGMLVNWDITDTIQVKAGTFSADRGLGSFSLDSFATEVGARFGTAIIRGTFVTSKDAGRDTGFEEIYGLPRGRNRFGLLDSDREHAYGINAEWYLPNLKLGFFGRYGWYNNLSLGEGGQTYSFGITLPDLIMPRDRLGVAYGRQLSNDDLRRRQGDNIPDVLEVYYDFPIFRILRLGFSLQQRNQFSETVFGVRLNTDINVLPGRKF